MKDRIRALREAMMRHGINAFIVPTTDPHCGEYTPERWKSRAWLSGFTGSAGTLVVTTDKAALWTDSRYFIQAAEQLQGSGIELMRERVEGTPSIVEWLADILPPDAVVGVDGWVNTAESVEALRRQLDECGMTLRTDTDLVDQVWADRPSAPMAQAEIFPVDLSGESAASKINRLRERLDGRALLVTSLEEVAWTLNIRGTDIEYTPLVVSYIFVSDRVAVLYIDEAKLTDDVRLCLRQEGVDVRPYGSIIDDLARVETDVIVDPDKTNYAVCQAIAHPVLQKSPIGEMMIIKNDTEIAGFRRAMEADGVAMVRWLKWLEDTIGRQTVTELDAAAKLEEFRALDPKYRGPSFESIVGYGPHGAIVHYEPTLISDAEILPEGLLLCDSGGQYLDGTTDITRTIPMGPLTEQMRRDYTLVLKGWIALGDAVFPKGTCGTQLDALARMAMWRHGVNYLHGTGHGVGHYMSVHECTDMHQIRMNWKPQPLLPGMTVTDEPGIYVEGSHGVRTENTMLVVPALEGEQFGPYYKFEHLTLCPVATSPIIPEMLTQTERDWLNAYHAEVYRRLSPHLDDNHRAWLAAATANY